MKVVETAIPGVLILEPRVFADERGFFYEAFNARVFSEATGMAVTFVQDNHSRSRQGVLRGLHHQVAPRAQGKLVRVIAGSIFDVAVDIRPDSSTFGKWVGVELSVENNRQMWIPEGFSHGFLTLSDEAEVLYKTTDYYAPLYERTIVWNDPELSIVWPLQGEPLLSAKDAMAPLLRKVVSNNT